eukprot:scaffold156826_cov18-Tisochrysis_lutea.AAC.2
MNGCTRLCALQRVRACLLPPSSPTPTLAARTPPLPCLLPHTQLDGSAVETQQTAFSARATSAAVVHRGGGGAAQQRNSSGFLSSPVRVSPSPSSWCPGVVCWQRKERGTLCDHLVQLHSPPSPLAQEEEQRGEEEVVAKAAEIQEAVQDGAQAFMMTEFK